MSNINKPQQSTSKPSNDLDSDLEEGEIIVKQVHSQSSDSDDSSPEIRPISKPYPKYKQGGYNKYKDQEKREYKNYKDNKRFPPHKGDQDNKVSPAPYYMSSPPRNQSIEPPKNAPASIPLFDREKPLHPSPALNSGYTKDSQAPMNPNMPYHQYSQSKGPQSYSMQTGQPQPLQNPAPYYSNQPNQPYGGPPNYSQQQNRQPPLNQPYNTMPNYQNPPNNFQIQQGYPQNQPTQAFNQPNYTTNQFNAQPLGFKIQYTNGPPPMNQNPPSAPYYQSNPPPQSNYQGNPVNSSAPMPDYSGGRANAPNYSYNSGGNMPPTYYNTNQAPNYPNTASQPYNPQNNSNQGPNYTNPASQPFNPPNNNFQPQPQAINGPPQYPLQQSPIQPQMPIYLQQNSQVQPQNIGQNIPQNLPQYNGMPSNPQQPYQPQPQPNNPQPYQQTQRFQQPQQVNQPFYYQPPINLPQNKPLTTVSPPFANPNNLPDYTSSPAPTYNTQNPSVGVSPFYYPNKTPQDSNNAVDIKAEPPVYEILPPSKDKEESNSASVFENITLNNIKDTTGSTVENEASQSEILQEPRKSKSLFESAITGINESKLERSDSTAGTFNIPHPPFLMQNKSVPPPPEGPRNTEPKKTLLFFVDNTPIGTITNEGDVKKVESIRGVEQEEKQYRLVGYDRWFKTQEKNLLDKLQKFIVPEAPKEEKKQEDKEKTKEGEEAQEGEEETDEFNFESRYFMYNPTVVCNRCKRPGHFEKWCTEEVLIKCMFCLGPHRMEECNQIVCFNCYGLGHRIRECKQHENMTCFRCGKRGHKNTRCGVLFPKDKEMVKKEKKDYNISTKCAVCGNYGHAICNTGTLPTFKSGYLDDIYDEADYPGQDNLTREDDYLQIEDENGEEKAEEEQEAYSYKSHSYPRKKVKMERQGSGDKRTAYRG